MPQRNATTELIKRIKIRSTATPSHLSTDSFGRAFFSRPIPSAVTLVSLIDNRLRRFMPANCSRPASVMSVFDNSSHSTSSSGNSFFIPRVGDFGLREVQNLQFVKAGNVVQAAIRDVRVVQIERPEIAERPQVDQPLVGDRRAVEDEIVENRQPAEILQLVVGELAAAGVDRDHPIELRAPARARRRRAAARRS